VLLGGAQGAAAGARSSNRTGLQHVPEWFALGSLVSPAGTACGTLFKNSSWSVYSISVGFVAIAARTTTKWYASSLPRPVSAYV